MTEPEGTLWAGFAPPYLGKWYATIEHKVLWFKGIERTLQIRAQHLDGPSPPATITIPNKPFSISISGEHPDFPHPWVLGDSGRIGIPAHSVRDPGVARGSETPLDPMIGGRCPD